MMVDERIMTICRKMLREGAAIETVLQTLRDNGADKIDSIRAITELTDFSGGQAKIIVHHSRTWSDRRSADEEFHENLFKALREGGFEVSDGEPVERQKIIDAYKAIGIDLPE